MTNNLALENNAVYPSEFFGPTAPEANQTAP